MQLEGLVRKQLGADYGNALEYGGLYLEFELADLFGGKRAFRLYHDGHGKAVLGIERGGYFSTIQHVSFDGFRLQMIYLWPRTLNTATIYVRSPIWIYALGVLKPYTGSLPGQLPLPVSKSLSVEEVKPVREIEALMLTKAHPMRTHTYVLGRMGSEIAYSIGVDKLGLKDLVISEISKGGKDLYTRDGKVSMQARLLMKTQKASPREVQKTLETELLRLVQKIKADFYYTHTLEKGYAVLSYFDNDRTIRTIILEVTRP